MECNCGNIKTQTPKPSELTTIEDAIYNTESWVGKSADQSGDDWGSDTLTVFQAISGSGDYGADADDEAKVLGADDTPIITGNTLFNLCSILIIAASVTTQYKLRIVYGTGTMAAAITAEQYSEVMIIANPAATTATGVPINIKMPRLVSGTKVWVQCKNATDNATIDFFAGLHEDII